MTQQQQVNDIIYTTIAFYEKTVYILIKYNNINDYFRLIDSLLLKVSIKLIMQVNHSELETG